MRRIARPIFVMTALLIGALVSAQNLWAGAWTMKKGGMYNRVAVNYYQTDEVYGGKGGSHDMALNGRFYDRNVNWYEEYGITNDLTFISSLYYKWLSYHDDYVHNRSEGPGDAEFGLRYKLYEGPVVVSVQGLVKYGQLYGLENPEIGNHQNDYELKLLVGKSLWPFPGYCNFELGYRFRDQDPADEVRYLAEFGMNFTKKLYGRVKLDGIWGMRNGDVEKAPSYPTPTNPNFDLSQTLGAGSTPPAASASATGSRSISADFDRLTNPTITPEFNLLKLDMTLGYQVTQRVGVELQYTPSIYGENVSKGATTAVALTYMW